ncbi:hypothetical protein BG004_006922 [Podila humilis]|nr:hypothetical protein BG004_006922 [Podila humilis]
MFSKSKSPSSKVSSGASVSTTSFAYQPLLSDKDSKQQIDDLEKQNLGSQSVATKKTGNIEDPLAAANECFRKTAVANAMSRC